MSCEYVRQYYGVPACIGRRVVAYGKPGIIVKDCGHHIGIALDDDPKRRVGHYHPVDGIVYGEMADEIPKPPKRTKWDQYYDEESSLDFHEWLGINKPEFESRGDWRNREYRMVRWGGWYSYRDLEGEWAPTMKSAKASYKAALHKRLAEERAEKKRYAY